MRKNRKALVLSAAVLTVIGAALVSWVIWGGAQDRKTAGGVQQEAEKETGAKGAESKETEAAGEESQGAEGKGGESEAEDKGAESKEAGAKGTGAKNPGTEDSLKGQAEQPKVQNVTLAFTGDILLSSYVLNNYEGSGINGILSDQLLQEMQGADLTMANEEFPFSQRGTQAKDKQFTFRVDPSYVKIFQEMGIDVVTAANNHALDFGTEALSDTFDTLDGAGIAYVGAGTSKERAAQPYVAELGGKKFGFLAASRVIPEVSWNIENQQPGMLCTYDSAALNSAIKETKAVCDYVVVYVHWGIERDNMPKDYQRQLGKSYIDAGADLVIGSHPHVLQGIEYYNGKPIVYSLGNYIFNQEIASTVLLKAAVTPENETILKLVPASAAGAKTQEMGDEAAAKLYQFMEEISFGAGVDGEGNVTEK